MECRLFTLILTERSWSSAQFLGYIFITLFKLNLKLGGHCVSCCHCNKLPELQQLKITQLYFYSYEVQKSKISVTELNQLWAGLFASGGCRSESISFHVLAFHSCLYFLGRGPFVLPPLSASLSSLLLPSHGLLTFYSQSSFSLPFTRTLMTTFRAKRDITG